MNRAECEAKLEALFREALDVYKQYNPEGERLTMFTTKGSIVIFNDRFEDDSELPIDIFTPVEKTEEGATE